MMSQQMKQFFGILYLKRGFMNNKLIIKFGRIRNSVITIFVNIPEWANNRAKTFYYKDYPDTEASNANYILCITDKMELPQMSNHVLWIPKKYSNLDYSCSYSFTCEAEAEMWIRAIRTIIKIENEKRNNIENIDADEIIIWNMEE